MNGDTFNHELLCVDSTNMSKIRSADNLAYSIMSNSELLTEPSFERKHRRVSDKKLTIIIDRVDTKNSTDFAPQNSYRVTMSGSFEDVENRELY